MTEEEIVALKQEVEAAKKAAEDASKALTDKEAKISQLNSALHEERSKQKTKQEEGSATSVLLDDEKIRQVAASTASEVLYRNEIERFFDEVSSDKDEKNLIKARYEQMKGNETDPAKLKDIILDAKFVTERRRKSGINTSTMGSAAGSREDYFGSSEKDDNTKAKKMAKELFGVSPEDLEKLSKPIDLRNK